MLLVCNTFNISRVLPSIAFDEMRCCRYSLLAIAALVSGTWARYIQLSDELDPADKGAEEIKRICKDRVNPYTGLFYGEDGRPAERS